MRTILIPLALAATLFWAGAAFAAPKPKRPPSQPGAQQPAQDAADTAAPEAGEAGTDKSDKREIPLSEPYERFCAGGGGRYLIFFLKGTKKLAVFDLSKAQVVHSIDLPGEDVVFAAGLEKLMVVLPAQKLLLRYSLESFDREATAPLRGDEPVRQAVMGSGGKGPLVLWTKGPVVLWDVDKMKPRAVQGELLGGDPHYGFALRAAANVPVFAGWTTGLSPMQIGVMAVFGNTALRLKTPDSFSFNGFWGQPSADGSLLFTHEGTIYTISPAGMKRVGGDSLKGTILLASDDPRFFLSVRPGSDAKKSSEATLCTAADFQPLVTLSDLEPVCDSSLKTRWGHLFGEPRIRYLPASNALVTLPQTNDRIVLRKLDLAAELDKSGKDYLFVTSVPPPLADTRAPYVYQIDALSKAGGLRYKIESGPQGMTVSETGQLRWKPLGSQAGSTQSVVVLLSDASGKETFHTFEVAVVGAAPGVASTPRPPRPEPRPPVVPRPAPAAVAPAAAPPGAAAPRTWTDATGAFEIEAVYLGFSAGVVRLRRSDGREVAVPLEKLSQADQGYVRRMAKP